MSAAFVIQSRHTCSNRRLVHCHALAVADDGTVRVHRVVCAIDCGPVVNPSIVEAQMESGIVYGLAAALHGEITIDRGRVQQSNFNDYWMLRMADMLRVEVHAATGKRIWRLPIGKVV